MIGVPLRGWNTLQNGFITQLAAVDSWYGFTFTANMETVVHIIVEIISLLLFFDPPPSLFIPSSLFLHAIFPLLPCLPCPSLYTATVLQHLRCVPSTWAPSPRPSTGPSAHRRTLAPPGSPHPTRSTTFRLVTHMQTSLIPDKIIHVSLNTFQFANWQAENIIFCKDVGCPVKNRGTTSP